MFEFAQTNLQLYRQMADTGYTSGERERVARAYRFLMPTFSAMYRGTEKPFVTHLVGTASILAAHRAHIDLVLAGLLHAVYMIGDFGYQPGTRHTRRKQSTVEKIAGKGTEAIIAAYDRMDWDSQSLERYLLDYPQRTGVEQDAISLQLANTLEDLLDHGVNYSAGKKFATLTSPDMQAALVALAKQHSWPELAERIEQGLKALNSGETPTDPKAAMGQSRLILPPSGRRRLVPTAIGWATRRLRRLNAGLW
jgi:hypothetical protein